MLHKPMPPPPSQPGASALPVNILLVDDQPANLLALEAILEVQGHNLVKARSGEEALQRLNGADDFALVLLDVRMPGLDGFETARLLRGRETSRRTPIIFLTAYESDRFPVERAYSLGAVDYLVKPLNPVIVRAKVAGFVELFEKTQQVKRQAEQIRQLERTGFERKLAEENARLRESEARKAAILETALDGIVTIDHEGKVIEFNRAAERAFGYTRSEAVGRDIGGLIVPPRLREAHHRGLAHYLATGEGPVLGKRVEMPALRKDGTEFPVELAITRIPTDGPPLFTAHLRDISERTRSERHRNARLAVNQVLAQAPTVPEAAAGVLRAVCESLGWDVGFFWILDQQTGPLRCLECWHRPDVTISEFEASSRRRAFVKGEGLPGHAWATGQPVWIHDVVRDANFPRAAAAAQEGLHGAFGCPLVLGAETLGVIEFFSRQIREPDADLLEMMNTVAGQVGQFIERRRAEGQLRRSEQELADFFENATIGLHWAGPDGTILRANRAELDLVGYSPEEYIGHNIADFHADQDVVGDILRRLQAGEELRDYVARLRHKDGSIRDVLIHSSVMREGGRFVHTRCFTRDITEQKRAEQALRESEQRFARFMQHLPGLAWAKDLQGRYVYANDAAERAFRTPRADLYGKTDEEVFPPDTAARFRQNDRQALGSGTGVQVIETLEHEGGVLHHSVVSKFPIVGSDGRVALVGGMAIDITDRLRAEEALKTADRLKDEFLAMLAHELRNPLAPVRTALHIMKQPGANGAMLHQARDMAERQVRHMARLLDDLLDVSRISRGKIELRKEAVDVAAVISRTVEAVRPLVEERCHELTVALPAGPLRVEADPTRLEQVLVNLLNNAAKYTDPGGSIWLAAGREGGEVVLRVRDTGIGIEPEMLPRVFDLFVQAERRLDRSQGGVGIGLTLVKKLVELHGGRIEASSAGAGRGSEFTVRLPALPHGPEPGGPGVEDRPGDVPAACRVLVVDDNVDAADSVGLMLRLGGHEVRVAYDGPTALILAQGFPPKVVLLDLGMPGMDGYEVARRLRELPALAGTVLVAVTGWGQEEDRRRTHEAGFDHHLTKPVDPATLVQLLADIAPKG